MDFLEEEIIVTKIILAMFMPKHKGEPIHRNRPSHGLVYYVDCAAVYSFESGETLTCHSGEFIYLPKGSNYTAKRYMENDTDSRGVYAINFLMLDGEEINAPFVMRIRGRDEIQSLFSKAVNAWRKKDVGFYEECLADLYKIIKLLKKESACYAPEKPIIDVIRPAISYINENYTQENIPLSHLAKLCGISEPYLRKLFHRIFSVSPAVYMRNLRIKYASELLVSGEYSVTDVAILSGFNDAAYFAREFKKMIGVSPTEYRKRK